eukprot:Phypoly_transcript_01434.p1 GENE.Phypoly_transcript_01434~~Phypoly_transcript_01434.p1  ORF type:complete len:371 (+),score=29.35 Phypoly_transcript_01434:905-2017(+)
MLRITRRHCFMDRMVHIALHMLHSVVKKSAPSINHHIGEYSPGESTFDSTQNTNNEAWEQIGQHDNKALVQPFQRNTSSRVVSTVVDLVVAIVVDISKKMCQMKGALAKDRDWIDLCKQKACMTTLLFDLLAEDVFISTSNDGPAQLALCIIMLDISFMNIIEYNKSVTAVGDGTGSSHSDKMWSLAGLGHFIYYLLVQHSQLKALSTTFSGIGGVLRFNHYYPCVLAPSYLFENTQMYIARLTQQSHNGMKGLDLAKCIIKIVPSASIRIFQTIKSGDHWGLNTEEFHPQLAFFKGLITWAIQCDDVKARTKAHYIFQSALNCYDASSRFALLSALLPSPYSSSSSLFIHRIKQEIDNAYLFQSFFVCI